MKKNEKKVPQKGNLKQAFNLVIENFVPTSSWGPRNPEFIEAIKEITKQLEEGQSVFIKHTSLSAGSVRKIVLTYIAENKSQFKNKDVRVVIAKKTEARGCRIVRYKV